MVDYFKLWIENIEQIKKIMGLPFEVAIGKWDLSTGSIIEYPVECKRKGFDLEFKSATRLEITGSLHKYWNKGTNENDFNFNNLKAAIIDFCDDFDLNPKLAKIINLEIGVNVKPSFAANDLIEEIICYKNKLPLRPYEGRNPSFYFIEFKNGNHYLKVYDKGKQYKTDNILRFEYKQMRSKETKPLGAKTLNDLSKIKVLRSLGGKLMQYCKFIIFNDTTINLQDLTLKERLFYLKMANPNNWKVKKGSKTSTVFRTEQNFISLVKDYGKRDIREYFESLIINKISDLLQVDSCISFQPNYNRKPLQK